MKRILKFLFVIVFISALFRPLSSISAAGIPYSVTVPKYENIIIDGFKDDGYKTVFSYSSAYGGGNCYVFNSASSERPPNAAVTVSSCWNSEFLYLYIEVSGMERSIENPGASKIGDGILFGVKTAENRSVIYSLGVYKSALQLSCLDYSGLGFLGSSNRYTSVVLPEAFVKNSDGRCVYEIAFGWKALGISPSENASFPFNIAAVFNRIPCYTENVFGAEMSEGFIESVIRGQAVPEFESEFILGKSVSHIHIPSVPETVSESTCKTNGKEITRCSECGKIIGERILPLASHKPGETVTVEEDPENPGYGYVSVRCVLCGFELSHNEFLSPKENGGDSSSENVSDKKNCRHSSAVWEKISDASCLKEGLKIRKCKSCSAVIESKTIPKTAHISGSWEIISFPSENLPGERVKRCKLCGTAVKTEILSSDSASSLYGIADGVSDSIEAYISAVMKMNGVDETVYPENEISSLKAAYRYFTECVESENWEAAVYAAENFERVFSELSEILPEESKENFLNASDNSESYVSDTEIYFLTGFLLFAIVLFIFYSIITSRNKTKS